MGQSVSRVLAGVLGAVAFGWFANAVPVAAPTAIVVTVIAFIFLVAVESPSLRDAEWAASFRKREWTSLALFSVSSVLLGAIIGALWMLPFGETLRWDPQFLILEAYGFHTGNLTNIELGAALAIAALALLATIRGASISRLVAFFLASTFGLALSLTSFVPGTSLGFTWLTWALAIGIAVGVVRGLPEAARQFALFFNFGEDQSDSESRLTTAPRPLDGDSAPNRPRTEAQDSTSAS